ncbi:MAG: ATP-dependent sacrificial sulfur transferase LarE [Gemmataceae bacterium]|nr:ATP-dependent sacrificial sulfur transferase LarE [Gemmataceae bacterium]
MESVAVALSGGVDSGVVARAAREALGDKALAVTADSPSVPRADLEAAERLAASIGLRHIILPTREFANKDYTKNGGDRCYFCKSELYATILGQIPLLGVKVICSGANRDDLGDYRPGLQAAKEFGIRHPLQEAGMGKKEVRELASFWGLEIWDKPASPCLSSRLAPGVEVTPDRTRRIELAEIFLKEQGIRDCRVRLHHGELARVEIPAADLTRLADAGFRQALTARFRELGFLFITLDLEGFRSGNLNQLVPLEVMNLYSKAGRSSDE